MRFVLFAFLLLSCFAVLSQSIDPVTQKQVVYPHNVWESMQDPSANGWNKKKLAGLEKFIIDSTPVTGMVVIQGGKIVFDFGDIKETSYLASVRKSILAMLYGPFVEDGTIDLNTTLEELKIDDIHGLLPIEKKATIKDLITARSGIYHPASNQGDERIIAPNRGTIVPGKFFLYNNFDFNLASHLLQKLTGKDIYDLIDSLLVRPLGMEDWNRSEQTLYNMQHADTTRSKYPPYHMWFSTRDMARIGYLMLRKGMWRDQQVLSSQWVQTITSPVTTFQEAAAYRGNGHAHFGYGYMWWVWDGPSSSGVYKDAYQGQGAYGQYITVLPALDLIIAVKTNDKYKRSTSHFQYLQLLSKLVLAHEPSATNNDIILNKKQYLLDQYTGEYLRTAPYQLIKITRSQDVLQLTINENEFIYPEPLTDSTFFVREVGVILSFSELHNGKMQQLNATTSTGQTLRIKRVAEYNNNKLPLKQFEGNYFNKENGMQFKAEVIDNKLKLVHPHISQSIELIRRGDDEFISKDQVFRFTRSAKNQKITGFTIKTKSLPDQLYLKK